MGERAGGPIDRAQVVKVRTRALRLGARHFLYEHAAEDLAVRIDAVNRTFDRAVDMSIRSDDTVQRMCSSERVRSWLSAAPVGTSIPGDGTGPDLLLDEEWIPFGSERLDLVASALVLHSVNDLPGTLIQLQRALRPDGLLLANLLGGETLTELRTAMLAAETEMRGGAGPRVLPFLDVRTAGQLLQRAGFALPVADSDVLTVRYDSALDLMRDLRLLGETNTLAARDRRPLTRSVLIRAAEVYADRFSDPDGRVRATFEIVTLTGWKPHESQQKPLRPGSARMRLADALNTVEQGSGPTDGSPDEQGREPES